MKKSISILFFLLSAALISIQARAVNEITSFRTEDSVSTASVTVSEPGIAALAFYQDGEMVNLLMENLNVGVNACRFDLSGVSYTDYKLMVLNERFMPLTRAASHEIVEIDKTKAFTDASFQDDFGRPLGLEPDLIYYGNPKLNRIYRDLNLSDSYTIVSPSSGGLSPNDAHKVEILINGVTVDLADTTFSRANTDNLSDRLAAPYGRYRDSYFNYSDGFFNTQLGNGTVTYVYFNRADEQVIISSVIPYAARVSNVHQATEDRDRSIDFELAPARQIMARPYSVKDGRRIASYTRHETEEYNVDDIVSFTFNAENGEIVDVTPLESVTGTVSRYTLESSIRLNIDGVNTDYSYAKTVAFMGTLKDDVNVTGLGAENFETDSEVTLYYATRNNTPYILWVDASNFPVNDYVLIRNTEIDNLTGDLRARLLFSDGTQRTVDIDGQILPENTAMYPNASADAFRAAQESGAPVIALYSERSDGAYRLTTIPTTYNPNGVATGNRFFSGALNVSGNSVAGDALDGLSPDMSTVFVILIDGNYWVFTGYRNLPTINNRPAYVYANGNDVKLVFVTDDTGTTGGSGGVPAPIVTVTPSPTPEPLDNPEGYALIRNTDIDSNSGELRARLLFSDGTQRTVDVDGQIRPENTAMYPNASADPNRATQESITPVIAQYSQLDDGTVQLTTIPTIANPNGVATGNRFFSGTLSASGNSVTGSALGGLSPDMNTVFVILVSGNYHVYTGYRNLPTIMSRPAYTYANGIDVKIVFVTDDANTTINSKDLIFISAPSSSNLHIDANGCYRSYAAVVDNRVTEVMVQADPQTVLHAPIVGNFFGYQNGYVNNGTPSATAITGYWIQDFVVDRANKRDDADKCIILNNTDADPAYGDIISAGYYSSSDVRIEMAYGYDTPKNSEIKLNTHTDANGNVDTRGGAHTWYVSPDVRVYEVDGGDIERVSLNDLTRDNDDYVYLAYDERDAEITYLFIVKHED